MKVQLKVIIIFGPFMINVISMNDLGKKKRTRGYTNMLDVWDLLDGEFILIKVDHWGNSMGWEGKTLQNAIGSLVRRHQCAP